jgi:hypothetical protein
VRRGLPVGLIWRKQDGEVLLHPDEAITGAIRTVFERFAEFGSARKAGRHIVLSSVRMLREGQRFCDVCGASIAKDELVA